MGFETSIPIVNFGPSLPLKTPATPSEAVKKQGVFVVWVVKGELYKNPSWKSQDLFQKNQSQKRPRGGAILGGQPGG